MFHVVFKIAAVAVYLFGGFFFHEAFIGIYVALILLVSMDFWTVKNVTGRLMVGLRWWNFIDDEGNSHWVFENKHAKSDSDKSLTDARPTSSDAALFWAALTVAPVLWFFLLLVALFRLNIQYFVSPHPFPVLHTSHFGWQMIVALALILSSSNLYGYIRCRVGSSDLKSAVTQYVGKQIVFNVSKKIMLKVLTADRHTFVQFMSSNMSNNKAGGNTRNNIPAYPSA